MIKLKQHLTTNRAQLNKNSDYNDRYKKKGKKSILGAKTGHAPRHAWQL